MIRSAYLDGSAGKSTTFKIITGQLAPSAGVAQIAGYSITRERASAQQSFGYCPQVDALAELLTPRETLWMFGRVRALSEWMLPIKVGELLEFLQLESWADKPAATLSGGNRRKLCVAIALLSSPQVLLLDEPSAGMDPGARRFLWACIRAVTSQGRTVLLTSHSMEEAEYLCDRIAIMVKGRFKCIGPSQRLKERHGSGYTLVLNCRGSEKVIRAKTFVAEQFAGAELIEEYDGHLRFTVPASAASGLSLGTIFGRIERANQEGALCEDYTLTQTSLENIFCNFAAGVI